MISPKRTSDMRSIGSRIRTEDFVPSFVVHSYNSPKERIFGGACFGWRALLLGMCMKPGLRPMSGHGIPAQQARPPCNKFRPGNY